MRIVLIRPPEINRIWVGIPRFFNRGIFLFPPLGIMQLKAYIERYTPYEVIIYDSLVYGADYDKVGEFIRSVSPQVVGISTFTHSLVDVVETAKTIKKVNPLIHITVGGPHTYTFFDESTHLLNLGCIDSVILGDGEVTFKKMLCALDKNEEFEAIEGIIYRNKKEEIVKKGGLVFMEDLDSLPFPARDIHGFRQYYTPASSGSLMSTIITSRGCPYRCKFCNVQKRYRVRSVKNVIDEMEVCGKLGFKEIFFIDDTFNVTAERIVQLSEEILRRRVKMKWGFKARCDNINKEMLSIAKKAGCFRVHYGVETGREEGLQVIGKGVSLAKIRDAFAVTKKLGIRTTAYFIIGCPDEKSYSDILETIDFAVNLQADFAVFSLLSPYPDSIFYKEGVKRGIFNAQDWSDFMRNPNSRHNLSTAWEEHFSKEQLLHFLKIAHRKFYYRPKIIFNTLFNANSLVGLKRFLIGGLSLLKLELLRETNERL